MTTPSSYWLDTAPDGDDLRTNPLPGEADVVVVGGGLTGLSAAIHLRRKGASVVVLEAERIGWGASGRNGGMCTTGLPIDAIAGLARYPKAFALFHQTYDDAIDLVERLVNDENIDCSFERSGKINLAWKPSHYERLTRVHQALLDVLGCETTLVPRDRIRTEVGTDAYVGGLVDMRGAGLHVGKFVRGLEEVAAKLGASLHEDARVSEIGPLRAGRRLVRTARGSVEARQVLAATNGYTDGAFPRLRRRVVPVGSFIVVTEVLDQDLVDELMPTRRMASDSKNLLYYFRITPDSRLLFGGRAQFALSSAEVDRQSASILHQGLLKVFPQLTGRRIDYAWGGLVGITLDRMPHAGGDNGLYYSLGYNGHGVQMSTYMGQQMAEVLDGHPDANPWRDLPFRSIPLYFGRPWFLPFADMYYRFRDAVS